MREKAIEMRRERDMTIDEIAERLAISRQTIFYWVKDIPLKERRANAGQQLGNAAMQAKYKALRDSAYGQGFNEYESLCEEPTFRDFVCMYVGEGYKRSRNRVSLGNSNANVVRLANHWLRRFSKSPLKYALQYHADQDPPELATEWASVLGISPEQIRPQRKSNSNQLTGRQWRSPLGVLTVCADDTLFRARLQAWMDRLFEDWLHSV